MPGIVATLEGLDLGALEANLSLARNAVSGDISVSIEGLDPRDLLGDLGQVLKDGGGLPSDPGEIVGLVASALGELGELIKLPHIGRIAETADELEAAARLIQDFIERLGLDEEGSVVDRLLAETGRLDEVVGEMTGHIASAFRADIPDIARAPMAALETIARGEPANAREGAALISRFFLGLDYETLCAPCERVNAFVSEIQTAGGDLSGIEAAYAQLAARVERVEGLLQAPEADVSSAMAELNAARTELNLLLHQQIPGALGRLTADLGALDAGSFCEDLKQKLSPLVFRGPSVPFDFRRDFMTGFRALDNFFDTLDADGITTRLSGVTEHFQQTIENSEIGDLPRLIERAFDAVIAQMRRVPLRELRGDLIDELNAIEARVRQFEGFEPPRQLAAKVRELEGKLDVLDAGAVQTKINEFAGEVQGAVDSFPISEIGDQLDTLTGEAADALDQLTGPLEQLAQELQALADRASEIDLGAAGSASVDLIGEIREKVQELGAAVDLPEPAKAAIAAAASALEQINITAEVRAPFEGAVAQIDVEPLLKPLEDALGKARETLSKIVPSALAGELEKPFDDVLEQLNRLRPAALLEGLSGEFQGLLDRLDAANPRELVAPLDAEFQKLINRLRDAADPGILFQPLEAAYQKLQELLEFLDLERFLGDVVRATADLPSRLTGSVKSALEQQAAAGVPGVNTDPTEELFRFGDVLRPIATLIFQLRRAVLRLADDVIGGALELLSEPMDALRKLVEAGQSAAAQALRAAESRAALLDPFAGGGPAATLRNKLRRLSGAFAQANLSAGARAQLGPAIAEVQIEGRADTAPLARAHLFEEMAALSGRLRDPGLAGLLRRLRKQIDELAPPALLEIDPQSAVRDRINGWFEAINPRPLVEELDAIGDRVQAKLQQFAQTIADNLLRLFNTLIEGVSPVMPIGLLGLLQNGLDRIRAEFEVLDPAAIKAEVQDIVDAVLAGLQAYSPARLAEELGSVFDTVQEKLRAFDPAVLLADLNPLENVIAEFEQLRPSVVLEPLVEATADLTAAFDAVLSVDVAGPLREAVESLKAQLGEIIAEVEAELQALIGDLKGMAGGGAGGGVSVSVGVG